MGGGGVKEDGLKGGGGEGGSEGGWIKGGGGELEGRGREVGRL